MKAKPIGLEIFELYILGSVCYLKKMGWGGDTCICQDRHVNVSVRILLLSSPFLHTLPLQARSFYLPGMLPLLYKKVCFGKSPHSSCESISHVDSLVLPVFTPGIGFVSKCCLCYAMANCVFPARRRRPCPVGSFHPTFIPANISY